MQPQFIRPPSDIDTSFRVNGDPHKYFYNPLHFHPEYELTYVIESHGTRFVGDSVENFDAGDMVLVGSFVPHCWKNHPDYIKPDSTLKAIAIVAQFSEDFAGESLFKIPEMMAIYQLLQSAKRGIKIYGQTKLIVINMMHELLQVEGYQKIRQLLDILDYLSGSIERSFLCNEIQQGNPGIEETNRLNAVYQYAMNHSTRHISLEEISAIASMSPTAFCRYFKKHTRKTFSNFMNEIRISQASRLLTDNSLPVSQLAFECGFANLSNFIRQFKKIKNISPLQYRKRYARVGMVG